MLAALGSAAGAESEDPFKGWKSKKKRAQTIQSQDESSFLDLFFGRRKRYRDRDRDVEIIRPESNKKQRRAKRQRPAPTSLAARSTDKAKIIRPGDAKPARRAVVDPELEQIVIVDNLIYQPDPRVALSAEGLAAVPPSAAAAARAVFVSLLTGNSGIRLTAPERDAVLEVYRLRNYEPLFVRDQALGERGQKLMAVLADAAAEGLTPEDYLPPVLGSFTDDLRGIVADDTKAAALDLGLTAMAVRYARHASGGRLAPKRISVYFDVTPPSVDAATAAKVIAWSPYPAEYLRSLHPQLPAYAAFRAALAGLDAVADEPIPAGDRVRQGAADERIPLVRRRLERLGLLSPDPLAEGTPYLLDEAMAEALKAFQRQAKLKQTGAFDQPTLRAFNAGKRFLTSGLLTLNMERLRWLPRDLGRRHVFLNQAAFRLQVMDAGAEAWSTEVVVGKPGTQTYLFHDEMETVVFNPFWGVPQSILMNEMMPRLLADSSYLDRNGYKVVNEKGKVVSSRTIKWWKYKKGVPVGIQQPPGPGNALGKIKFLFPNEHAIYMHDTPAKQLFKQPVRAFSHGCVRVQNPERFAEVLLGWQAEDVAEKLVSKDTLNVRVPGKIPVHLTYFTAWPRAGGAIEVFADVYGRDQKMEKALTAVAVAQR